MVTCAVAKFLTVEGAAVLPELVVAPVVAAVLVVVEGVVPVLVVLEVPVVVVPEPLLLPLTAEASDAGRPVEAAALDTGPWLVAMMSGA